MLVILILVTAYLLWLGFALRKLRPRSALLAWITSAFTGFLTLGGFFGFL